MTQSDGRPACRALNLQEQPVQGRVSLPSAEAEARDLCMKPRHTALAGCSVASPGCSAAGTHAHVHAHTCAQVRTHLCTRTCLQARTSTHTPTRTHTPIPPGDSRAVQAGRPGRVLSLGMAPAAPAAARRTRVTTRSARRDKAKVACNVPTGAEGRSGSEVLGQAGESVGGHVPQSSSGGTR